MAVTGERTHRFKRRDRFQFRLCWLGLALGWLTLMGWPTRPGPFPYTWGFFAALGLSLAAAGGAWLHLFRTNPQGLRGYLSKRRLILLLAAASAGALLAAEAASRLGGLADWGGGQGPLQTSYRLARYRMNSLGFRGEEFPPPGDRSGVSILGLGDSFAFGQGVEWKDTFLKRVEAALNQRDYHAPIVRTLNASQPGWNTVQQYSAFEKLAPLYSPEAVIVAFTLNDAELDPYFLLPLTGAQWEADWLWRSHLYFLLTKAYNLWTRPYEDFITGLYGDDQPGWRNAQEALRRIAGTCRRNGRLPLLVVFPLLQDMDRYRFDSMHEKIGAAGRAAGFEVVDLLGSYRAYPQPTRTLRVSRGDWHPNAEGHRLAAEAVLARFKQLGWPRR